MIILGLDLGIGSIGWALIEVDNNHLPIRILGMGSRIVPLSVDETSNFEKGRGESVCSQRTLKRTARKGLDRYQMRRATLKALLAALGMNDEKEARKLSTLPPIEMWKLRADAATEGRRLTLTEIGHVLLHLNQKRGYKHSKTDASSSDTKYVQGVNENFRKITEAGETIGQYHYRMLKESQISTASGTVTTHRIKDTVYPRKAYVEEFDRIMEVQKAFYPEILTDEIIASLRDIIFFQRPLKSCKHLVSACEFEKRVYTRQDGTTVESGPKVAPRTSPLAQVTRLYETINNIRLVNPRNRDITGQQIVAEPGKKLPRDARLLCYEYPISEEERVRIFEYLNTHSTLTVTNLLKLLGLKKSDGFSFETATKNGIKGNDTFVKIAKAIGYDPDKDASADVPELLKFNLNVITTDKADKETGELLKVIDPGFTEQPLYRLWHLLYSISDHEELSKALQKQFGIEDSDTLNRLCDIDFVTPGFSNRSARFMRRLLPYLMEGFVYSEACTMIGVNHSGSVTGEENAERPLLDAIPLLGKNSLRQPTVEKILNQMINVVNALLQKYGPIEECRVELARELKQSKPEREQAYTAIGQNERENKKYSELIAELGIKPSRTRIQKYKLWLETGHQCMYCGATVGLKEFLESHDAEIEHIIPRSLYFDDSMSNKTCACRKCNHDKGNMTAFDFMKADQSRLPEYVDRVEGLFASKVISKRKRDYLLMPQDKIPTDFLNRDLRLSQYIAKKSCEILRTAIRNVTASSGRVTDFFRHAWGYDRILHDLNLPRYEAAGLVEPENYEHKGQIHTRPAIKEWTKRLDHRHHAIDALTVALTRQSYIQLLNTIASNRPEILADIKSTGAELRHGKTMIMQWADTRPHFSVTEVTKAVDAIAVSFKAGKKVTTPAKRKERKGGKTIVRQSGIAVPRGELHKETVYGRILVADGLKPLKYAFEHPELIINHAIRRAVSTRIEEYSGDTAKAISSLKKTPLKFRLRGEERAVNEKVNCYRQEFVVRKPLSSLVSKQFDDIIDPVAREAVWQRFRDCGNSDKNFQTSIATNPIILQDSQLPIKSVRLATGISEDSMVTIRKDASGQSIGYAQARNNHHVAFYVDEKGKVQSVVVSFWDTVRRRLNHLPIIVKDAESAWDMLMYIENEEIREEIARTLPMPSWKFLLSMQINDMFIVGMTDEEIDDAIRNNEIGQLASHLYRVQKLSDGKFFVRFHTSTVADTDAKQKDLKAYIQLSNSSVLSSNLRKVKVDVTGNMIFEKEES